MSSVSAPVAVVKHLTLLLLHDAANGRLLLGLKKRGFGAGKLNGFGGKIEPGESILAAALREMREESGLRVEPPFAALVGHLSFDFEGSSERLSVHVFRAPAAAAAGALTESDEMAPQWVPTSAVPYGRMWQDDVHWLPLLLAGKHFVGAFSFRGGELLRHTLAEVDALPAHLGDPAAVLVHQPQTPLTPQG
jgi:8-oxo-dGTP diphosphatase/2-hydroxy-dATP diphosphatase